MFAHKWLALGLTLGFISGASQAHAEPLGSHQPSIAASLGPRVSKVASAGFDPFAGSDDLAQVSVGVSGTLLRLERFSLAAVGFWDYGSRSATARNSPTSLDVHRLTAGPEGRYQLLPMLYVFAHALPAFAHAQASLDDGITQTTFVARHWSYGVDLALGAAYQVYGMKSGESTRPRLWLIGEGGYGSLGRTRLLLKPEPGQGAPERTAPIDLGSLSLAGPYLRLSAAVSL